MKLKFSSGIFAFAILSLISGCSNLTGLQTNTDSNNLAQSNSLYGNTQSSTTEKILVDKTKIGNSRLSNKDKKNDYNSNLAPNDAKTYVIRDEAIESKITNSKSFKPDPNVQLVGLPTSLPLRANHIPAIDIKEIAPAKIQEPLRASFVSSQPTIKNQDFKKSSLVDNDDSQTVITKKYTVKKGDTLYSISKKNNVSLEELAKNNKIKTNTSVKQGQTLILGFQKMETANSNIKPKNLKDKNNQIKKSIKKTNINKNNQLKSSTKKLIKNSKHKNVKKH